MESTIYDYAIIGAGAAGLNLGLAMHKDPYFQKKKILIIEKEDKSINDKTWCFWEKGIGELDEVTSHQWKKSTFINSKNHLVFDLLPYQYKMIHSSDFYRFTKEQLEKAFQFDWIKDEVLQIEEQKSRCVIKCRDNQYLCRHAFDSRVDPAFIKGNDEYFRVQQHFKGWFIKTKEAAFDPETFTMMDFRIKHEKSTSFTYVLPTTPNKALVEYTLFTPQLIPEHEYDVFLKKYIKDILKVSDFEIIEMEKGIIPMSDYPFHKHHTSNITKIGTAGGWVRPSSGYSFKNAQVNSIEIIENIKSGKAPSLGIAKGRFRKYDTLFLDVLANKNYMGEKLFTSMYKKNDIKIIFEFLDESTPFYRDLQIISGFPWKPFSRSLIRNFTRVTSP